MECLVASTHQCHCRQEVHHKMVLKIQISKNRSKDISLDADNWWADEGYQELSKHRRNATNITLQRIKGIPPRN